MTKPGFFELYPAARPTLPAGHYTAVGDQQLVAQTPHDGPQTVPIDDADFHFVVDAPRYQMPPDQILSTFPPAGSQGDWRERLPQIVLKRRTLPWERNPDPTQDPEKSPPWLALVVLAEGEGRLVSDVDPSQCVSDDVDLGDEADVPVGKYLEVSQDVVDKVFPCQDELDLLCHVRKVDLSDTELALGDDDGFLAVVLSSRLPQPAPPTVDGGPAQPLKYTAYLINLEKQLPKLLETEPDPILFFDTLKATALVDAKLTAPAPNATLDQIAMGLGPALVINQAKAAPTAQTTSGVAPFQAPRGIETTAGAWQTGPSAVGVSTSKDLMVSKRFKEGFGAGFIGAAFAKLRFPVLVSWDFTCTDEGGFERLMNSLDVGLLGTVDEADPPPGLEVAATGHIGLNHRTRRGDATRSWYRGPLTPQPTLRSEPDDGVLPLAHTGDQLRKLVPDGREDVSLAALFEIGRLLTLNKPTLVAELMQWRRELFGAARARELADALVGSIITKVGLAAVGGRDALEQLVRNSVVGSFTGMPADALARPAPLVTSPRVPDELADLGAGDVLNGLGLTVGEVTRLAKTGGVDALGAVRESVLEAPTGPVTADKAAFTSLSGALGARVDDLVRSALKVTDVPPKGEPPKRSRRKDDLDRLIAEAEARATGGAGREG